jgi:hypothetical protein
MHPYSFPGGFLTFGFYLGGPAADATGFSNSRDYCPAATVAAPSDTYPYAAGINIQSYMTPFAIFTQRTLREIIFGQLMFTLTLSSHLPLLLLLLSSILTPSPLPPSAVEAATPSFEGCSPSDSSGQYFIARYQNIPAFSVAPGDIIVFTSTQRIGFASIDFGTDPEPLYTAVVYDSEATSRGFDALGNYEMQFIISAPYTFPGGQAFNIRFQKGGLGAQRGVPTSGFCYMVTGRLTDASR